MQKEDNYLSFFSIIGPTIPQKYKADPKEALMMDCIACGSDLFHISYKFSSSAILTCNNCGLRFVRPLPDVEAMKEEYDKEYFSLYLSQYKKHREARFIEELIEIEKLCKTGKILDVGCAYGFFLNLARNRGWEVFGVDISEHAAEVARQLYGLNIFIGTLEESNFPDSFFDVVTLWTVLEHIPDPLSTLIEIRRILKPDGLLVIEIPNRDDLLVRTKILLGKISKGKLVNAEGLFTHHLYYFTEKSIRELCKRTNYKVINIKRITENWYIKDRSGFDVPFKICAKKLIRTLGKITKYGHSDFIVYAKKSQ